MRIKEKLRNSILNKIKKLPDDKLSNLDSYLNDLELRLSTERSTLSFRGIFQGLELNELTKELHELRKGNSDRIPKF